MLPFSDLRFAVIKAFLTLVLGEAQRASSDVNNYECAVGGDWPNFKELMLFDCRSNSVSGPDTCRYNGYVFSFTPEIFPK